MPNEWKVVLRAADGLNLSEQEKERYTNLITKIYSEVVVDSPPTEEHEQYANFLNNCVFSDSRLVAFLEQSEVSQAEVSQFRSGQIDVDDLVLRWNQIRFTVDELIDLVMMMKLIRDYSKESHTGRVESRHRLQKLIYVVNSKISRETNPRPQSQFEDELGMLDRTGYRYQFLKRDSGPYAEAAYEDKNRLFAWNLIDEPVIDENGTGEVAEHNHRYATELSAKGEVFTERFYDSIENSDSIEIQSWTLAQKEAIDEVAPMTQDELQAYISSIVDSDVPTGSVYLSGPSRKFRKNNIRFLDQLASKMNDIMHDQQTMQGVVADV